MSTEPNMKTLNKVRNGIMHAAGDASLIRGSDQFITEVNNSKELSFLEHRLLMVSDEYIVRAINDMKKFLTYLVCLNET